MPLSLSVCQMQCDWPPTNFSSIYKCLHWEPTKMSKWHTCNHQTMSILQCVSLCLSTQEFSLFSNFSTDFSISLWADVPDQTKCFLEFNDSHWLYNVSHERHLELIWVVWTNFQIYFSLANFWKKNYICAHHIFTLPKTTTLPSKVSKFKQLNFHSSNQNSPF